MQFLKALFVLFLITTAVQAQHQGWPDFDTTKFGNNAAVGKYAEIRGFKMYYEIYGKGEPLLLLNGNSCSIKHLMCQIAYFSKYYKVIVPDTRAQGKSLYRGDSLTFEMLTDDYYAFLNYLKIDSCNIIGWSDGGNIGLMLAMKHPEKVKKMAVTGANLRADTLGYDPEIYDGGAYRNTLVKEAVTPEGKNKLLLFDLMYYQRTTDTKKLKNVKCPVLVIAGDHDVIRTSHTLDIAQNIPRSYLWILPNSGHATLILYRDIFNDTVYKFLKSPYRKIEGFGRFE